MEKGLLIVIVDVALLYLISQMVIYIKLRYYKKGSDDSIQINISLFDKILLYSMEVPVIKLFSHDSLLWLESKLQTINSETVTHTKREKQFARNLFKIYFFQPKKFLRELKTMRYYLPKYEQFMRLFMKCVVCETLCWKTTYGAEDAAKTGLAVGAFWAVKSIMLSAVQQRCYFLAKPVIQVTPVFGRPYVETELCCIFKVRVGEVITAMKLLMNLKHKGASESG